MNNNLTQNTCKLLLCFSVRSAFYVAGLLFLASCQSGRQTTVSINDSARVTKQLSEHQYVERLAIAENELTNKHYNQATQSFMKLHTEYPSKAEPTANLGLISFIQKDLNEAKNFLVESLRISDTLPGVHNLLGLIALNEKDIKLAETHFTHALSINYRYANAHYNLALLYEIYLQDINKAAIHYRSYLENTNPNDEITADWLSGLESVIQQSK